MAGRPHRREAEGKYTSTWAEKVDSELFTSVSKYKKTVKPGRWDPYDRFTKQEDVAKFYSGHAYRRRHLIDRENFAKFAIAKILEGHPDDDFQITGEIMKNELVTDQSDEPEALDDLERAIRADAQRDVDAEVIKDATTRSKAKDESTQKVSAAAQSIIAASPNSLGPPVDPCAAYLKMTECGRYGRSNSTVWRSPLIPTLDGIEGRRGLLDHQITAVVWLLSRFFGELPTLKYKDPNTGIRHSNITNPSDEENRDRLKGPKYFGGILADSMGLGKTLITVALVDLLIRQKLNVAEDEEGNPIYRPILLITPNATVANQWVQEFTQVIDKSILRHIVISGPGLATFEDYRVIHLGRDNFTQWPAHINYMWDENNPRASQTVLIMTMESWAARTCKKDKDEEEWYSSFTKVGRGFSLVIVDEAYKVKNHRTKNWRSVHFLKRQFTLLITATPCMNSLTDLFGVARLLWTAPEEYLKKDPEVEGKINHLFISLEDLEFLDDFPLDHDFHLVAGRPGLLAKLFCKSRNTRTQDIDMTRRYLKYFETLAMLKRSPSSYLYSDWEKTKPISLEGLFPKVENYTVDINVSEAYSQEYQRVHIDFLIDYLECLRDWGRSKKETKKKAKKEEEEEEEGEEKGTIVQSLRLLQLASASLDVYDLNTILELHDRSTLAPDVAEMRDNGVNFLRLAQFLIPKNGTRPETHVEWMKLATQNSPVLRYILHYIKENILTREMKGTIKKLLIIEQNVMLAFYYELCLQFLGFECRCMHAQLSFKERQDLINSFNDSDDGSCQILIQLYTVGFAGTNLHKSCSRVLIASQSHSLPVQWQAMHRVIRVGQNSDVTVHRVKLKNSFHTFQESRQIEKILPELGARAQGNTKKVLVRLLNLFQYEVRRAWESPEGQKLLQERNLLDDEEDDIKEEPASKKIKLENGAQCKVEMKEIKKENENNSFMDNFKSTFLPSKSNTDATLGSSSKKRSQEAIEPKSGDGYGGWYDLHTSDTDSSEEDMNDEDMNDEDMNDEDMNDEDMNDEDMNDEDIKDIEAFLELRTRDEYYDEFISLPREAKSLFNHSKNNLRRLLSYGNIKGKLSDALWKEDDLSEPAVLERALELMLRVRLGANDIAMLPFPIIDLSGAEAPRRRHLQRLLAEMTHTDQDFDAAVAPVAAVKDLRETLRGSDVKKPLAEIEKDLEAQAKFGDLDWISTKKVLAEVDEKQAINPTADEEVDGSGSLDAEDIKEEEEEMVVLDDDDEDKDIKEEEEDAVVLNDDDEDEEQREMAVDSREDDEVDDFGSLNAADAKEKGIVLLDDDSEELVEMMVESDDNEVIFVPPKKIKKEEGDFPHEREIVQIYD